MADYDHIEDESKQDKDIEVSQIIDTTNATELKQELMDIDEPTTDSKVQDPGIADSISPSSSEKSDKYFISEGNNESLREKRIMKKDDSGICVEKSQDEEDSSSGEMDTGKSCDDKTKTEDMKINNFGVKDSLVADILIKGDKKYHREKKRSKDSSCYMDDDFSSDSDEEKEEKKKDASDDEVFQKEKPAVSSDDDEYEELFLKKKPPKHKWFCYHEVRSREYGYSGRKSMDLFRLRTGGSLHMAERLELMYKMEHHEGCVNTLHFNSTGTRLASGSDDLNIVIWDWAINQPLLIYDSGHRSNVFQAKFMPLGGDCHIVSCARDGQVRVGELSATGVCKGTKRLAQHKGAAHKLALENDSPQMFLSCGEDAVVYEVDLREEKANKLVTTKENDRKIALYTIFSNPSRPYEFAVGGRDHYVRIYDKRKIAEDHQNTMKKFCPHHLIDNDIRANVTCLVYNHNGSEILTSYNDEDIYVFDSSHSDGAEYIHRYRGHRNNATVKGVNYYGSSSEYIVSGSDCGHIFLWDKETERVVQFVLGDEGGVVNCLEPHPNCPILATSGLDSDIKIWVPSCEEDPKLEGLRDTMKANRRDREEERRREPDVLDGHMLWFIMQHLRRSARSARARARAEGQDVADSTPADSDSDESEDDDSQDAPESVQCAPS